MKTLTESPNKNSKIMVWALRILLLGLVFKSLQCAHKATDKDWNEQNPPPWTLEQPPGRVSVMAYNVENLFDTEKDPGKEDYTFLPLKLKEGKEAQNYCSKQGSPFRRKECVFLDWDDKTLKAKIENISKVVLQVRGKGPDILILAEVENLRVLQQLNREGLASAGYKTEVLLEGEDSRGIDVGVLSRFPLAGTPKIHKYRERTRGILEVPLKLPSGETVSVFAFHFPSQANPTADRVLAITKLKELIESKGKDALVIAGGDGNITTLESRDHKLLDLLRPLGFITHLEACQRCKGTHNYKGQWDFLDWIFVSNSLARSPRYKAVVESVSTPNQARGQMESDGLPYRFDPEAKAGVADHLPIYLEIQTTK